MNVQSPIAWGLSLLLLAAASITFADDAAKTLKADETDPAADIEPGLLKELKDLDARLVKIEDLRGRFTQKKHTSLLKEPLTSFGSVLVKGQHMKWQVDKPAPSVTLTTPGEIRIYYPQQKLVEIYKVDERLASVIASPLPRLDVLAKHFKIERLPPAKDAKADDRLAIRLTPRKEELSKHLTRVDVSIDRQRALAMSMELVDADGDRTVIAFEALETNTGVKDEQLELTVPRDTRVVRPLEAVERGR